MIAPISASLKGHLPKIALIFAGSLVMTMGIWQLYSPHFCHSPAAGWGLVGPGVVLFVGGLVWLAKGITKKPIKIEDKEIMAIELIKETPLDIWIYTFSYLDPKSLALSSRVCSRFYKAVEKVKDTYWKNEVYWQIALDDQSPFFVSLKLPDQAFLSSFRFKKALNTKSKFVQVIEEDDPRDKGTYVNGLCHFAFTGSALIANYCQTSVRVYGFRKEGHINMITNRSPTFSSDKETISYMAFSAGKLFYQSYQAIYAYSLNLFGKPDDRTEIIIQTPLPSQAFYALAVSGHGALFAAATTSLIAWEEKEGYWTLVSQRDADLPSYAVKLTFATQFNTLFAYCKDGEVAAAEWTPSTSQIEKPSTIYKMEGKPKEALFTNGTLFLASSEKVVALKKDTLKGYEEYGSLEIKKEDPLTAFFAAFEMVFLGFESGKIDIYSWKESRHSFEKPRTFKINLPVTALHFVNGRLYAGAADGSFTTFLCK